MDDNIKKIILTLANNGFEVAIIGGAVREILEDKDAQEWDLTTDAKPQEIQNLFKKSFYNNRFGTVGVTTGNKTVEITTFRTEQNYSDSRHPDIIVWGKTLEEDLARRDFTINAIAIKPKLKLLKTAKFKLQNSNFDVVDPYGGQDDLKNKVIRTVGDPDSRFEEDALRLMRALRFATVLGFDIENKTKASIKKNGQKLLKISRERIRDELFKIIQSDNAAEGMILARDLGLLKIFLPELDVCFNVEQKSPKRHHIFDVGTHCVMSLKHCPSFDLITRFATLLHDIGKAKVAGVTPEGVRTFYNHEVVGGKLVRNISDRFHLAKDQREKLFRLVRWHQFSVSEEQTDKALRRFIKNIGVENIEDMMDLRIGDRLGGGLQQPESWRLKLFRSRLKEVLKKPFTVTDLKISGGDVMSVLQLKPGPRVGVVLNSLFEEVLDDAKKNNRKYLLERIKTFKEK